MMQQFNLVKTRLVFSGPKRQVMISSAVKDYLLCRKLNFRLIFQVIHKWFCIADSWNKQFKNTDQACALLHRFYLILNWC